MRAVVLDAVRARPEVREVADPTAPVGGVVVRVMATGLCRSDWHAWAGHDEIAFPHVPGHELAGVVAEVDARVGRWRVGDRVTVPFVCGCGRCAWCRAGDAQVCPDQQQPGFTHWGSFAEYVALHGADTNLVALPEQVDFATAAALGCRFATAYRALVGRARVVAGEWVTVVGAGGVGLSTVMIARALGARVVAVDRNPQALAVATGLGAEQVLAADGTDVPAAVADLTGGGSHVAVDAVGSEATCADAVLSLRRRGRHVQVGLLPPVEGHPRVPMARVIAWELDLLGSHGMAALDYPAMMALIEEGSLQPQRLVERTIGLDEAAAALPDFDRAVVAGMTMVDPARLPVRRARDPRRFPPYPTYSAPGGLPQDPGRAAESPSRSGRSPANGAPERDLPAVPRPRGANSVQRTTDGAEISAEQSARWCCAGQGRS
ncbi:zinc-dependent alcohol dehydrogenase family protein [Pseudonocardia humida]|uniref:Zinc-dependent alcohol dehydrogenase family protein n=1 Tax=Pseudonocardia humida TaxID=2800819 RepID=A0ABT1A9X1_9PSEU|nr:zinc-dependent alcohol dehydrogenase family protein [Pseudonocardia humida]MCO1659837.1 zinc-dependent alcohol dehydrogenase family protein [Pseudonocardia humida]